MSINVPLVLSIIITIINVVMTIRVRRDAKRIARDLDRIEQLRGDDD